MTAHVLHRLRTLPTATLGKLPKADRKRVVRWWKVTR